MGMIPLSDVSVQDDELTTCCIPSFPLVLLLGNDVTAYAVPEHVGVEFWCKMCSSDTWTQCCKNIQHRILPWWLPILISPWILPFIYWHAFVPKRVSEDPQNGIKGRGVWVPQKFSKFNIFHLLKELKFQLLPRASLFTLLPFELSSIKMSNHINLLYLS